MYTIDDSMMTPDTKLRSIKWSKNICTYHMPSEPSKSTNKTRN